MSDTHRSLVRAACSTLALTIAAATFPTLASAKPLSALVRADLATIERDADAVSRGRVHGSAIYKPAREIAVTWDKIEPKLIKNGNILVETKMANSSIVTFERTWKKSARAKTSAHVVEKRIAALIAAARS